MKARKLILIVFIAFVGMIFSFSAVQANTIALSPPQVDRYINGGPFIATVSQITPDGLVGDGFITFCLEKNEFFSWYKDYNYEISPFAVGGSGGAVGGQDPLDPMSAYLYYNFRMNPDAYNQAALQAAFWHIEDEDYLPSESTDETVENKAWEYVHTAEGKWTGIGPVVVLNLFDGNSLIQSQLGLMVPEPTTVLLLGLGLFGLGLVRKKS